MPLEIGPSAEAIRRLFLKDETTQLNPEEERLFQQWTKHYKIGDVDDPQSFYDYRGYWKENPMPSRTTGAGPIHFEGQHFPDTYKQRGHPTFSQESKYSGGPFEGGRWIPNTDILIPPFAVGHRKR